MIALFDFKSKEPEKVPTWQYAILYLLFSFLLAIIFKLIISILGMDQSTGLKTTAPSALIVAYMFVYKYKRVMTKSERKQVIWYSIFLTYMVTALYLYGVHDGDMKIGIGSLLAIMTLLTLMMYFVLHFVYDWFSRMVLKQMNEAEEKRVRQDKGI